MGKRRLGAGASSATSRMRAQGLVVFGSLLMAGQAATELSPQGVQGRCEIRFIGSSTLHDFSGAVRAHVILDGLPAKERKIAALVQPPGSLASGS